eukprot:Skav230548  [mRNA]  locus=scaffold1605:36277:41211:- [translate_table: standard]
MTGEYFTSPDYWPIRSLAGNSKNGVVQAPTWSDLGDLWMRMRRCARCDDHMDPTGPLWPSTAGLFFSQWHWFPGQHRFIRSHLHQRVQTGPPHHLRFPESKPRRGTDQGANTLAMLGDIAMQAGNTISAINAFSAVFNVALTLLAQSYTARNMDYQAPTFPGGVRLSIV